MKEEGPSKLAELLGMSDDQLKLLEDELDKIVEDYETWGPVSKS